MARVSGVSVPPSLAAGYVRVIQAGFAWNSSTQRAERQNFISPQARRIYNLTKQQWAQRAGAYLADVFVPRWHGRLRSGFVSDRAGEVLAGSWPTEFWENIDPDASRTVQLTPTYGAASGGEQWTGYWATTARYADPPAHTAPPNPSAGWQADNTSGAFRDNWLAQHCHRWNFGETVRYDNARPYYFVIDADLELSADAEGNRFWGQITVATDPDYGWFTPYHPADECHDLFRPQYKHVWTPSAPAAPWSETISRQIVAPCWATGYPPRGFSGGYTTMFVCAMPPHGRYRGTNTSAQCWLTSTATAYRARTS